ncbi:hypothetical protein G9A89_000456 [Geosiphon pyriformis]|nr:hypothetical protein G9A89_000456 [Geosiphon pyriformis]
MVAAKRAFVQLSEYYLCSTFCLFVVHLTICAFNSSWTRSIYGQHELWYFVRCIPEAPRSHLFPGIEDLMEDWSRFGIYMVRPLGGTQFGTLQVLGSRLHTTPFTTVFPPSMLLTAIGDLGTIDSDKGTPRLPSLLMLTTLPFTTYPKFTGDWFALDGPYTGLAITSPLYPKLAGTKSKLCTSAIPPASLKQWLSVPYFLHGCVRCLVTLDGRNPLLRTMRWTGHIKLIGANTRKHTNANNGTVTTFEADALLGLLTSLCAYFLIKALALDTTEDYPYTAIDTSKQVSYLPLYTIPSDHSEYLPIEKLGTDTAGYSIPPGTLPRYLILLTTWLTTTLSPWVLNHHTNSMGTITLYTQYLGPIRCPFTYSAPPGYHGDNYHARCWSLWDSYTAHTPRPTTPSGPEIPYYPYDPTHYP